MRSLLESANKTLVHTDELRKERQRFRNVFGSVGFNTSQTVLPLGTTHNRTRLHSFALPTLPQNLLGTEHEKNMRVHNGKTQRPTMCSGNRVTEGFASSRRVPSFFLAISSGDKRLLRWPRPLIAFAEKMAWEWNQLRCTSQQTLTQHFLRVRGCLAMLASLIRKMWNTRSSAQHALTSCIGTPFSSLRVSRCSRGAPRNFRGLRAAASLPFPTCHTIRVVPSQRVLFTKQLLQ